MMITRKIKLPLNGALKRYLASGDYNAFTTDLLSYLDLLYTYFLRYPRLFVADIGGSKVSQGFPIDCTDSHPLMALTTTLLFASVAVTSAVSEYNAKKKMIQAKEEQCNYKSSYRLIRSQLTGKIAKLLPLADGGDGASKVLDKENIERLNQDIQIILNDPHYKNLCNDYKEIVMTEDGNVEFILRNKPKKKESFFSRLGKKAVSILNASCVTLGLCSFVYWILWIGCGVFTGDFSAGISVLGSAAFITPLAVGAIYPVIRIRNWWRNHYGNKIHVNGKTVLFTENSDMTMKAALALSQVMRKLVFKNEKDRLTEELKRAGKEIPNNEIANIAILANDQAILMLGKNKWKRITTELLATTVSAYIGAQYAAWLVTDLLKVAANITLNSVGFAIGFGIAFMVCSVAYGVYKAYKKHKEIIQDLDQVNKIEAKLELAKDTLEKTYKNKLNKIHTLNKEIGKLAMSSDLKWLSVQLKKFNSAMSLEPKSLEQPKPKARTYTYAFINGITSGALLARVATIAGTAMFLPFTVAALGNPYTIGIVVVAGFTYGLFKLYQYHQAQKEAHAKEILAQRKEKIASLTSQIELANLQLMVLQNKKEQLQKDTLQSSPKGDSRISTKPSYFNDSPIVSKTASLMRSMSYDDADIFFRFPRSISQSLKTV